MCTVPQTSVACGYLNMESEWTCGLYLRFAQPPTFFEMTAYLKHRRGKWETVVKEKSKVFLSQASLLKNDHELTTHDHKGAVSDSKPVPSIESF